MTHGAPNLQEAPPGLSIWFQQIQLLAEVGLLCENMLCVLLLSSEIALTGQLHKLAFACLGVQETQPTHTAADDGECRGQRKHRGVELTHVPAGRSAAVTGA